MLMNLQIQFTWDKAFSNNNDYYRYIYIDCTFGNFTWSTNDPPLPSPGVPVQKTYSVIVPESENEVLDWWGSTTESVILMDEISEEGEEEHD